jgi:DNA polymerase III delta prime subunit
MMEFKAVQLYDEQNADRSSARFICFSADPPFNAAQFVIVECPSGRSFLGSVSGPNLNFNRNALGPTHNTAINQAEQIAFGKMNREVAVREDFFYEIRLLREIVDGRPASVRTRPKISSVARPASEDEIIRLLAMPDITPETQIGGIIDTDVPVCVSKQSLMYHTLVAGSTGSGKTNTIANIARSAVNEGLFVIIFDHKPDYQNTHEPNDEGTQNYYGPLARSGQYWFIGDTFPVPGRIETRISVPAQDLNTFILAAAILHRDGEELQRDTLYTFLDAYSVEQNGHWAMGGFIKWLQELTPERAPGQPNKATFKAIQRKASHPNRIPTWIDGRAQTVAEATFGVEPNGHTFHVGEIIRPGSACIVRIGSGAGDGREYGLLLSYILDKINEFAEQARLPCPVLVCIDEAQDIFSAGRSLRSVATEMLDRHVRKGRSKRIGYLFGVQSSASVPDAIMNNLNNRFIHKHNSPDELRVAANMATDEQRKMTATFGAGECLAYLYGANAIIHSQMRRSPFKLTKEDL